MNQMLYEKNVVAERKIAPNEALPLRTAKAHHQELLPATGVHPGAIGVALGASTTLLAAAWVGFAGGETSLVLVVVTVIVLAFFGCLVGGGMIGRNMTPDHRQDRSFAEFLRGDVDIETGRISGREALMQIAALPVTLAAGGIAIIAIALWTA
ncbi:hypothetical protein [Aminobacter sp. MSH1]|uniref:hypothetical protein n=1 Tax=Aminobacter sp. MSH1 TaxID=374606 RepID=UPI000D33E4E3|nr:hypothetical protein [Aminobacter sp. MSH1]